jgi:AcrR family transcriptional regulator
MGRQALTREDWIRAAYCAFEARGVESVLIEPLCRTLEVSKGSFYWHFKDRAELLEEVFGHWSRQTSWFRLESEAARSPAARLERLGEVFAAAAGHAADRAMMRWAQRDAKIAARVTGILRRRGAYVATLLRMHGLAEEEAAWRAEVISFAYMGWLNRVGVASMSQRAVREWTARLVALALAPTASQVHPRQRGGRRTGPVVRNRS